MSSPIEKNRNHLVAATINTMLLKSGHKYCSVKLPNGEKVRLQIGESKLLGALVHFFEAMVYDTNPRDVAEKYILSHYQNCLNGNKDRLTYTGVDFMNSLIENVAEEAFINKEEN